MKLLALFLAIFMAGCASGPPVTPEITQRLTALQQQMNADWAAGKYTSHEVLEATYAIEYNKIYPLNELGYEYMSYRVNIGRRIDQKDITFEEGDRLIRQKSAEIQSRVAAKESASQRAQIDAFMRAVGVISAAGLAYAASQPQAPAPTPTILCRQSYAGVYCQ